MREYVNAARATLGLPTAPLDGVSHSGGYHALAAAVRQVNLSGVGLLDSLYGEYMTFRSGKFSCLVDIYGNETDDLSEQLKLATRSDPRFQIARTSILHTEMPATYIRQLAFAFPTCGKVKVIS